MLEGEDKEQEIEHLFEKTIKGNFCNLLEKIKEFIITKPLLHEMLKGLI